jgi:hypothetical protein
VTKIIVAIVDTQTTATRATWSRREYTPDFLVPDVPARRSISQLRSVTRRAEMIAAKMRRPIDTGLAALIREQRLSAFVSVSETPDAPTKVTATRASA